ncbi:MAG: 50S ribosomal protein L6 [Bacilli bacterium]|nr:50S ribosomal protein L6 [Bacilli bacterium]
MSRIGQRVLTIPTDVVVNIDNNKVIVKGPKGELKFNLFDGIKIKQNDNQITIERENDSKELNQLHGTANSIIANMLVGVSEGFKKDLEILGVGYRFQLKGNQLVVNAGFSHPVEIDIPSSIEIEQKSNTEISIKGIDKEEVGEFAANIRKIREPEPYKGKGIRYKDERVRRKEGKKAA